MMVEYFIFVTSHGKESLAIQLNLHYSYCGLVLFLFPCR
ncbi:hypothetical protein SLEP1_g32415 [Rubroshorea leprosula]|uniref:Uncharacterized protein n=1 Tax=Rubroshorea leprosula TaxID=152421 RepID=A0AAV5KDA4_9ROSI|nr:hypothetical protein SLEP1_g32415 [Rubroshorea leprosula]